MTTACWHDSCVRLLVDLQSAMNLRSDSATLFACSYRPIRARARLFTSNSQRLLPRYTIDTSSSCSMSRTTRLRSKVTSEKAASPRRICKSVRNPDVILIRSALRACARERSDLHLTHRWAGLHESTSQSVWPFSTDHDCALHSQKHGQTTLDVAYTPAVAICRIYCIHMACMRVARPEKLERPRPN